MKIYKTKKFDRQLKGTKLNNQHFIDACLEMAGGLIDADHGGHLYKKRIPLPRGGKSGGYRSMLGAKIDEQFFFLYIFPKGKKANISQIEERALKDLAKTVLNFSEKQIASMLKDGSLIEILTGERHNE